MICDEGDVDDEVINPGRSSVALAGAIRVGASPGFAILVPANLVGAIHVDAIHVGAIPVAILLAISVNVLVSSI